MSPEKVKKSLAALDESAKNSYHLMDNLLQWSRSRLNRISPRMGKYNALALVNETLPMFSTILLHKEIALAIQIDEKAEIMTDTDLFSCILRNLVSNAIKFTPHGGKISIRMHRSDSLYTIEVADTGIGISEEMALSILSTNTPTTTSGLMNEQGAGLGLLLCREFSVLNGGTFTLASTSQSGSVFSFTVMAATQAQAQSPNPTHHSFQLDSYA